jgi:hypothetical protein
MTRNEITKNLLKNKVCRNCQYRSIIPDDCIKGDIPKGTITCEKWEGERIYWMKMIYGKTDNEEPTKGKDL